VEPTATTEVLVARGPAIASFIAYLVVIVAVGVWATRFSSAGVSEYFIGGRKMHRFVVALSAVVSGRSAWLIIGVVGMAYAQGASAVWAVVGYITVEMLLFLYYARRLRRFSEAHDCITVPDVFAERFGDPKGLLRLSLVAIFLVFIVGYVAGQFVAGGKAFAAGFGLEPTTGILLTAGIVLVYTVLGGFLAVSLTDMIQALFMIVALVVVPAAALAAEGGLSAALAQIAAVDPTLVDPAALGFGAFLGFLGIGLGSPGNPHILARYMSIERPEQLRTAAVVGTVWNVVMAWGALFAGLAGRAWFPDPSQLPGGDTESLYPVLAGQVLPPAVFGLVIAAIFAAIMSTTDSQLLVAASAVVRDVYEKVLHRHEEIPQRRLVLLSRTVVVVLVALSVVMGFYAEQVVFWLVLFSWAGLGASLGPTSLLTLYWKGTTRAGVLAGLFAGALTVIAWKLVPALDAALYELIPGFLAGLVATVVVSRIDRRRRGATDREADAVDRMFREMGAG
jgi:sodium/proline symporter